MIEPPGFRGAVFGEAADGDPRSSPAVRSHFSERFGAPDRWSWPEQVHGSTVLSVDEPGSAGAGDGLLTGSSGLAVAVATADCVPVIIEGARGTVVVHAGWRGMAAGVVDAGVAALRDAGDSPTRAAIGPSIGPCCYEVGSEVLAVLGPYAATTTWGTSSVDLWSAAEAQLGGLEVWRADICTYTDVRFLSHRRDRTRERQVSVTWISAS
ncbi:MAG: peptidoglycan editing factor PgeF [Acidimicrobiia bacterium]|nr:MAG: peptidoglycan editing factor PgeF [Acidimicrobiia bacterium]